MRSLQGQFLVASPHLPDSNFYRSVVLIAQHDEEGAFGMVLNRPTEDPVREVWHEVFQRDATCRQPVYLGGPVDGPLLALHTIATFAQLQVGQGLYLATDRDFLDAIVNQSKRRFRIFSGYSGWSAGQLEAEIQAGGWLTAVARPDDVFSEPGELWKTLSRRIGLEILGPAVLRRPLPEDPSLN